MVTAEQVAAAMDDVTVEQVQAALDAIVRKSDEGGFYPALTDVEAEVNEVYLELLEVALGLNHFVPAMA